MRRACLLSLVSSVLVVVGCSAESADSDSDESNITAASSAFTSLVAADCRTLPTDGDPEMPFSQQVCAGQGGLELLVEDSDERMNVQVKNGNKTMDLSVWTRLPSFSHLGEKADWRGTVVAPGKVDPYALIFRYFQSNEGKETNFLVIARVSKDTACIVDAIDGTQANANVKAHEIADRNRSFQCPTGAPVEQARSIFTKLEQAGGCTFKDTSVEIDSAIGTCPGTDGYTLEIHEGDLRENVTVVHGNKKSELFNIGGILNGSFSSIGPTADWRVNGPDKHVHALIFRYFEADPNGNGTPATDDQYLFVSKVTPEKSCIVDIIDAKKHPDANVLAHVSGDKAAQAGCPAHTPKAR